MAEADMAKLMYADNYNVYTERYLSLCVTSFNLDMEKDVASQINIYEKGTIGLQTARRYEERHCRCCHSGNNLRK